MSTPTVTPAPRPDDIAAAYQATYDALGKAYWDATDMASKDLLHGTQEAIGEMITAYDEEDLASNTALYKELKPKIDAINTQLTEIKTSIAKITKNISTITTVLSAVNKVLSLFPTGA